MKTKPCTCPNVVQYEPNVWKCRECRRRFLPVDICAECKCLQAEDQIDVSEYISIIVEKTTQAEPQQPVEKPTNED